MTNRIQLPGQSLPAAQFLYPSELYGAPVDAPTNRIGLAAGDAIAIPTGSNEYLYDLGAYSMFQWQDPIMGVWRGFSTDRAGVLQTMSNGVNLRVANLTGCPIAADIAGGGSGFTQATATITANVGGSTWQPVVGGSLSVSSVTNTGARYTVPPMVLIPSPPAASVNGVGGVPATAYASIANGTVSGVTLTNVGAGYSVAPTAVLVPSPFDVNLGTISNASISLVLVAATADAITAAFCTNNGAPLATLSALTLTAAGGAGSGATITPQVLRTVTSASVVAGGVAWGTATAFAKVFSVGGFSTATETIVNPISDLTGLRIREVEAVATTNAGGTITGVTFNDRGLFLTDPTAAVASGGTIPTTLASITFATGALPDVVLFQPL